LNKSVSIHVDKNLIEGPNPNQRGKLWIPLVFALQVSTLWTLRLICFLITLTGAWISFSSAYFIFLSAVFPCHEANTRTDREGHWKWEEASMGETRSWVSEERFLLAVHFCAHEVPFMFSFLWLQICLLSLFYEWTWMVSIYCNC